MEWDKLLGLRREALMKIHTTYPFLEEAELKIVETSIEIFYRKMRDRLAVKEDSKLKWKAIEIYCTREAGLTKRFVTLQTNEIESVELTDENEIKITTKTGMTYSNVRYAGGDMDLMDTYKSIAKKLRYVVTGVY